MKNPRCYASKLDGCSEKMSDEHPLGKDFTKHFSDDGFLEFAGLPFAQEPKKLHHKALARKILCITHNNALSKLDASMSNILEKIKMMFSYLDGNIAGCNTVNIDGPLFERSLLKVMCGYIICGFLTNSVGNKIVEIPLRWLAYLFCQKPFAAKLGIWSKNNIGDALFKGRKNINFALAFSPNNQEIRGMFCDFSGMQFFLVMDRTALTTYPNMHLYHPASFNFNNPNTKRSARLNFEWLSDKKGIAYECQYQSP